MKDRNVTNVYQQDQQAHRVSLFELIQKAQPVAFDVLQSSMRNNRVSHAYLFYGEANCYQEEFALWFAESLLMNKDGFYQIDQLSPDEINRLQAISNNEDGNFIHLDGSLKTIGKQLVDDLQEEFSKTSFTNQARRVYLITGCENMSYEASNSLLKFLEEPSENVIAILTTSSMPQVLETIVSRCIPIPFKSVSSKIRYERAVHLGYDEEDAYFLSRLPYKEQQYGNLVASSRYQNAKSMFKQFLDASYGRAILLVDYETIYKAKNTKDVNFLNEEMKDRDVDYETLKIFFGLMIGFYQDLIAGCQMRVSWYQDALANEARKTSLTTAKECLGILLEQNDQCNRFVDYSLLLFQTMYRLEEQL